MITISPAEHREIRRGVHPSQRQHHIEPVSQPLHLICVISNPERYYNRYKNYEIFERHITNTGALLYTVELALRDRHHEITRPDDPFHLQLRSESQLWHKENLIDVGMQFVTLRAPGWEYGGYLDADFMMSRADWVTETIHMLQHYQFVQLFSTYQNLSKNHTPGPICPGFVKIFKEGGDVSGNPYSYDKGGLWGSPGGGWAWRRRAFNTVGGMLDTNILGSADWHMAVALAQVPNPHKDLRMGTDAYRMSIDIWAERAKAIDKRIGYIENHMMHLYHGEHKKRGYETRTQILKDNAYDPYRDVSYDCQGVLTWAGNKPQLEEDVRQYFCSRDEDN